MWDEFINFSKNMSLLRHLDKKNRKSRLFHQLENDNILQFLKRMYSIIFNWDEG